MNDWHRIFGLVLTDFFTGSPFVVELEKDLSLKQQFLDVVIIRKQQGTFAVRLPDGLEDLANYNLLTFKSHQEVLSDWTLKELIGHYVNYRKQISASVDDLMPEGDFRLYAVCTRYPQKLAGQVSLKELKPGVYDCNWGTDLIRIVVLHQLSQAEHNALGGLFSAMPELVQYALAHYQKRSAETSTLIDNLLDFYRQEGFAMPYTMEDFRKEYLKKHIKELTPEERVEGLSAEELLKAVPTEERLHGLSAEEIENYLKTLKRKGENSNGTNGDNGSDKKEE